jgi:hypothetical protein
VPKSETNRVDFMRNNPTFVITQEKVFRENKSHITKLSFPSVQRNYNSKCTKFLSILYLQIQLGVLFIFCGRSQATDKKIITFILRCCVGKFSRIFFLIIFLCFVISSNLNLYFCHFIVFDSIHSRFISTLLEFCIE